MEPGPNDGEIFTNCRSQKKSLSSRMLAEPARCRRAFAKLAIRDPVTTVPSAGEVSAGSRLQHSLLAASQPGSCSGRDDSIGCDRETEARLHCCASGPPDGKGG